MNMDKNGQQDNQLEGFCRGCLIKYDNPTDLLQYTEKNRHLFFYSTGLQVKRNDIFTFQLCKDCYINMMFSCKFKKQCRMSEKRFKNYLRLKEVCDVDLCTFLKSNENILKFPLLSGSSTPAYQTHKDDDNESTSTSIQNFMTDILQGTDMPVSDAGIIKQILEEEADVLEESIDSHWLQDDMSIDTDFRLDFSFSPFSTSRSVNKNQYYAPTQQLDYNQNNNHAMKVLDQLPSLREPDDYENSPKDININGRNKELKVISNEVQIVIEEDYIPDNIKEKCINANDVMSMFRSHPSMPILIDDTENDFPGQSEIDIAVKNIDMNFHNVPQMNTTNMYCLNDLPVNMSFDNVSGVNKKNYVLNDLTASKDVKVDNIVEHQTEYKVRHNDVTEKNTTHCSIDKNLQRALINNSKEIPLDDLLASPSRGNQQPNVVSAPEIDDLPALIRTSTPEIDGITETPGVATLTINAFAAEAGASTPMINNILFGEKLELDEDSNSHKMGQCIEKYENVDGDEICTFEDFFNKEVKVFDQYENDEAGGTENIATDNNEAPESEKQVNPGDDSKNYDIEKCHCKICDKKFLTEKTIKGHMMRYHRIKIPKKTAANNTGMICPHCGVVIMDRGNYFRHIKTHKKLQIEYKCQVCTLTFPSETTLKQHSRVHNISHSTEKKDKIKKHVCSTCGATFALSSNLMSHARRHAAPALSCNECGKGFHTNHDLKRHERTHTGERPHRCPVAACNKSFVTRYNLVTHMRIHTDEKPYQCDYCSIKFSKKGNLVKHISKSSKCIAKRSGMPKGKPVMTFSCYFCQQKYATRGRLIKHQEQSASCIQKREEMHNMNRSTIKVQMPFLYPGTSSTVTSVNPTPLFTIKLLNQEQQNH